MSDLNARSSADGLLRGENPVADTTALNFVQVAAPVMRSVEDQLATSIAEQLPDWHISRSILKERRSALNFTFFVTRPAQMMMSHGVADKNYLLRRDDAGLPLIDRYRRILVPGPWLRDRLLAELDGAIAPERIEIVGWPRLDLLLRRRAARGAVAPGARRRLLWAPTLSTNSDSSSYPQLMRDMPALKAHFDVAISVHPADRGGGPATVDQLLDADVVVADHGTMLYEAWALGKPVIFPSWIIGARVQASFPGSAESHIFAERIGLHASSLAELIAMAQDGTGCGDRVDAFMADYLPLDGHGRSCAMVADAIRRLSAQAEEPADQREPDHPGGGLAMPLDAGQPDIA